ncbi:MAG: metallophosphoesterase [Clostridia bacterium]|nr:metallophosphoesterase [Clostridia bacterium]
MSQALSLKPTVFAVGNTYQILIPVSLPTLMWVKVGEKLYHDDAGGVLRSSVSVHRVTVPAEALDRAREYTVCYREMLCRKPYFSETGESVEERFSFRPVGDFPLRAYHIADAHGMVDAPVASARAFEKRYGPLNFLILNGDVIDHSGDIRHFSAIYEIAWQITGGEIPVVFARGNHDTRGACAEKLTDYTPTDYGKPYFSFRLGPIWGVILDCGEDKDDSHPEYGFTNCCHHFRLRETDFLKELILRKGDEYEDGGVRCRLVVVHNPFTRRYEPPFNIEESLFSEWAALLRENIHPDLMICGHLHTLSLSMPGSSADALGQPCPVWVGAAPNRKQKTFTGSGFVFSADHTLIVANRGDEVIETHRLPYGNTD